MQKGVQTNAICNIQQCWELLVNNVAPVCTHGAYGYRNLPSPFPGQGLSRIACIRMCTCMNRIQDDKVTNYPAMNFLFKVNFIAR